MAADGSVVIQITGDDKEFKSTLGKLGKAAGAAVKGVATAVSGTATLLGGLGAAAVKVGSDFESSMSQVAATMGLTAEDVAGGCEEFRLLSLAAKEAGATTAFSATEAAGALNYLALAGYDAQKSTEALPAVLNLAAAGGLDLAYASDLATDAMAALGIEASGVNLTRFGDELAAAASHANASISQLGEAILTVGGTAKGLAGGTVELNTALGVLANRGIKGSEGGTALRNMILALSAPTDTAALAIDALGLAVYDAAGNMRPLNEVFKDLGAAMEGMSEGEKTQVLNSIFNKVDLKSAQALLAGCGEEFDSLMQAISGSSGAMQNMSDIQLDNLQGDITILKSGLEGLGVAAYDSLQGPIRESIQLVTGLVGEISEALSAKGLSGGAGAIGGVLAQMAAYAAQYAPKLIDAAALLLRSFLKGIQDNLPEIAAGAVGIVESLATGIISLLPQLLITAAQLITALALGIAAALPGLIPQAVQCVYVLAGALLDSLPMLVDAALELVTALAEGIAAALPVMAYQGPVLVQKLVDALTAEDTLAKLLEAAADIILVLAQAVLDNLPEIMAAGNRIIDALITGIVDLLGDVQHAMVRVYRKIWDTFTGVDWAQLGRNLIDGIVQGVKNRAKVLYNAIKDIAQNAFDAITGFFEIESPSKLMRDEVGQYLPLGIAVGAEKAAPEMERTLTGQMQDAVRKMQGAVAEETGRIGAGAAAIQEAPAATAPQTASQTSFTQIIQSPRELSPAEIGQETQDALRRQKWRI